MATPEPDEIVDSPTEWVAKHVRRYVESDGRDGARNNGYDTLLITTRGRKSGKLRRTALIYGRHGDDHVVVASNGGSDQHPAWYLNLLANPEVDVQVGADKFTAQARATDGEERAELWTMMVSVFPVYTGYQEKAHRTIPVVVLRRTADVHDG
ncbi:nitroreductase family deazaflavin-dependent oxidoreductase [Sphaerisporangium corydalis]|uniref:Nitroreductase family deazaflavin-dependent oxidoreductase n=1 Tax=Sphaerisporangium corydalis TaxID=1441875 RepID=A0ABV9ETH2_9ACTN|nr:nitroreductase family deazaflavin-dependent oxidoreductase [Sphaerisporangium corydalis]